MEKLISSKSIGYRKSLGPGILLAAACIGGSHLMSSTTAGAKFGFSLIGLILLTNLVKYPFLLGIIEAKKTTIINFIYLYI